MRTGCKNFERLNGNEHIYTVLGEEYANVRGFDKEKCIRLILEATKNRTNNQERPIFVQNQLGFLPIPTFPI